MFYYSDYVSWIPARHVSVSVALAEDNQTARKRARFSNTSITQRETGRDFLILQSDSEKQEGIFKYSNQRARNRKDFSNASIGLR